MDSGLVWRKSSYSGGTNGDCVEVALGSEAVAVRDSKSPSAGVLSFDRHSWRSFLRREATTRR
ncbi:DUF397 domain-containing protein [Amycolatopsis nigrescens]|uniref:DUF397 domain-containing protein n=1 Tax=Amycolatopsis nigrescens TaxID=381445 RepID=UPI0003AA65FB|nr:DUF397 domain-containing protein [Amycolatopsis nigrescens]